MIKGVWEKHGNPGENAECFNNSRAVCFIAYEGEIDCGIIVWMDLISRPVLGTANDLQ